MTVSSDFVSSALSAARREIEEFGLPTPLHFELSLQKGQEIADVLGADVNLVIVGVALMDLKLGQAFSEGKLPEHVAMSVEAAKEILREHGVNNSEAEIIINSVEAHHGSVPFESLEAEIVANADCYRFIHPRGVIHYIGTLTKRDLGFAAICNQAESKLEEKWSILTLPRCKEELRPYYEAFKGILSLAREP